MVAKDEDELADMLFTAMQHNDHCHSLPGGIGPGTPVKDVPRAIPIGQAELLQHGEHDRSDLRTWSPGSDGAGGGRQT
jgi:1-deoxy-D-xylulose-5-phosphate synthase